MKQDPQYRDIWQCLGASLASQVALMVRSPSAFAGDARAAGLIPGSGRSLGEENGNALQYSFLENPMDIGSWWATVHGIIKEFLDMT